MVRAATPLRAGWATAEHLGELWSRRTDNTWRYA